MDMIGDASDAIAFAVGVAGDRREIGAKIKTDLGIEQRDTIFGAENDVDEEIGERLGHGERINRAFSPWVSPLKS